MGLKIYLDDQRKAPEGWIRLTSARKAIQYLKKYIIDEISLDHDLGPRKYGTGYDVLLYLEQLVEENEPIPFDMLPKIHIHTSNPVARKRMEQALESIKNKCKK